MQLLLILVVLMIVMCMFNKTRETFKNFKGYGRFGNAYCRLTDRRLGVKRGLKYIEECKDKCDKNSNCEGFNTVKGRDGKYVCEFSVNDGEHCGDYRNRGQANGVYYFFKTPEKEAARPVIQGSTGVGTSVGGKGEECANIAQERVLQFRKAAIDAIMRIR